MPRSISRTTSVISGLRVLPQKICGVMVKRTTIIYGIVINLQCSIIILAHEYIHDVEQLLR